MAINWRNVGQGITRFSQGAQSGLDRAMGDKPQGGGITQEEYEKIVKQRRITELRKLTGYNPKKKMVKKKVVRKKSPKRKVRRKKK